jgi:hypothetical protein
MLQEIELARRQSLDAQKMALDSNDHRLRAEWLRVAHVWEELSVRYEKFVKVRERESLPRI